MAIPTINFSGYVYNDAGVGVANATVKLFAKNLTATSLASDTTDGNGRWDINYTTANTTGLDIEIKSGDSYRRIKYQDKIHLEEVDTALLNIRGVESTAAALFFYADEGEDVGDRWKFNAADGGVFTILNDASGQGSYVAHVTITPHGTVANSIFAIAGTATIAGKLTLSDGFAVGSDANGDVLYSNGTKYIRLARGSDGDVLTLASSIPSWSTPTTGDITAVSLTGDSGGALSVSSGAAGFTLTGGAGIDTAGSSTTVTFTLDLNELTDTAIANGDYIIFTDATDSNATVKGDLADVATLFAGTGLTASGSVIGVDASQSQITTVGTIGTGEWQGTTIAVNQGGTGATSLSNLITLATHTTGDFVGTITGGTGISSTGGTSGEDIDHTLSVDAAQTGITSLGTQAANFAVGNGYGVIIGNATQETVSIGDGAADLVPELQVLGTTAADSSMLLAAFSATATTAGSPIIALAKGGNATLGSHTIVTDGEELGNIIAFGDDGVDLETPAASIQFEVDGTPGAGDMPGRILLSTTADGATALTERIRIASAGQIGIAGANYGTDGQVLTSGGAGAAVAWEDAGGGGGTLEISHQGTIPAGAPVAIDSNGRAVVVSGLGSELAMGASHTTVADTVTNSSAKNYSSHYQGYAIVLVDCGSSGVVRLTPDEGYNKVRGSVGAYSTSHVDGYTSLGSREMSWGVETLMTDGTDELYTFYLNAIWDVDTSEVVIMWVDQGDSNKMKIAFWDITDGRLEPTGTTGTVANYGCNVGKLVGLDYDKDANKYICAWSKASGHGLYTSVWENSGGNPAVEITEDQVGSATTTSSLSLKWADGGDEDIGLIVWEEAADSHYAMACSMTHNDDDTIYHSSIVEPFGANTRVDFGDNQSNRNISYDTSTTAVSGDFDSGDDLFLIAGAITATDHQPIVVPIAAGGGGGTSPTISATGTVEYPYAAKPADWGGHSTGYVAADDHVINTLNGQHVSICYDPDRDCHVLIFRIGHYYLSPDDGGYYVNGSMTVSQTMIMHTDNTILDTYNTAYHHINGNRQNPSAEYANRTINRNQLTYGFGTFGVEMIYHTTYNTMFIAGEQTITYDIDSEYEYYNELMFAFNGNTSANGGSAALTYAASNIDRIAGLNTTAISNTGTVGNATITLPGSVNENVASLVKGTKYFMGDSGTLTTKRPIRSRRWLNMGVATDATTKILVKADAEGQQH